MEGFKRRIMTDNKRTKTIELLPTTIFDAVSDSTIEGDLAILMYEDGSVLFTGTSVLENQEFVRILGKISAYLDKLNNKLEK
jgi:hypothetical protein